MVINGGSGLINSVLDARVQLTRCSDAMRLQPAWHRPRLSASVLLRSPLSQLQARRQHHALSRPLTCSVAAAAAGQVQKRSRSSGDNEDGQNEFADYKVLCYSAQKYVLDTMEDTFRETFPNISFVEVRIMPARTTCRMPACSLHRVPGLKSPGLGKRQEDTSAFKSYRHSWTRTPQHWRRTTMP